MIPGMNNYSQGSRIEIDFGITHVNMTKYDMSWVSLVGNCTVVQHGEQQ